MGSIALNSTSSGKLLISIISEKATWLADHTFMRYPTLNWETDGYRTMTWRQYADAINKTAYWLDEQLGKSTDADGDAVAYLGPNDARYSIVLPAMIKSNRNLFIPDRRVTKDGLQSLIEATRCTAWVYAGDEAASLAKEVGAGLKLCTLPSLEWCLDSKGHKDYPYNKTFEEAKFDVILIIHTSGTTGLPKPIYHTNGFHSCTGSIHTLSRNHWPRGIVYDSWIGKAILSSCPPQWLAGIHVYVFAPIFYGCSSIIPPPTDPETQPLLKSLKFVVYLGAALDQAVGDDLCQYTKLTCIIGSTETGPQTELLPVDKKLWYTHAYVPENGHRMERIAGSGITSDGSDDLYQLVLERPSDGEQSLFQCAFWNPMWRHATRVETKEMYAPVLDADGRMRWVFSTRKDDLTKLNWLAKFHAQDIESRIKQHPDVSNVFVGGEGRPTPFVIVEPREGVLDRKSADDLLDDLYSGVISQSSERGIEEITIPRETVLIAKKAKPFRMSAKQTILRSHVQADYAEEIDMAYTQLEKVDRA